MNKYINADKLEKDGWSMQRIRQASPTEMIYETKKPTDFPAADVQKIQHGRWTNLKLSASGSSSAECSLCGAVVHDSFTNSKAIHYCPNCGAKMYEDGE